MEQEIEQLRILVGDLFSKIESLEERLSILEDERAEAPKGPEPILTCVQCLAEYKESENAEGYCKYHTGSMTYHYSQIKLSCCNSSFKNTENMVLDGGCVKGKHQSKHHTQYFYTNYLLYMRSLSNEAEERRLEMDIYDYVTECCQWAEVGVLKDKSVYVLAGSNKVKPEICATIKPQEFKKYKKSCVLCEKHDDAGWYLKSELIVSNAKVEAITVTIKSAWTKVPYVKRLSLTVEADKVTFGDTETISDPKLEKPAVNHVVPEESRTGPVLDAGEDYTKNRKNDYPTITNDDMFGLELKQVGATSVNSSMWGMGDNKWENFFTANIDVTNGSLEIIEVLDVLGEYQNKDGEWVKCDNVHVGLREKRDFMESKHFLVDAAAPMSLVIRLVIVIQDPKSPSDNQERARAHHLLPQPLLLRATLTDKQQRTASLIFEQGNPPLPLATLEKRQANWAKKRPVLFHLFADDAELRKRSDAAIYNDDELNLIYRPAPNDSGSTYYYLRGNMFETVAYKAKKSGVNEQEFTGLRSENKGSKIELFGVVDLDSQHTFALKVVITTPTSSATGYYLLPDMDVTSQANICTDPTEVEVNSELTVTWNVQRPSKSDRIKIYKEFASNYKTSEGNRKEIAEGCMKLKAPGSPGVYEVRYYPSCLESSKTGFRHSLYSARAKFTVVAAT